MAQLTISYISSRGRRIRITGDFFAVLDVLKKIWFFQKRRASHAA